MQLRRLTMGALFNDFLHDLTDLDSRVWRTLIALLTKPGKLTNEFIAGRRTLYLPPFRLYLVLSLIFFLLPSSDRPNSGSTWWSRKAAEQDDRRLKERGPGEELRTGEGEIDRNIEDGRLLGDSRHRGTTPIPGARENTLLKGVNCSDPAHRPFRR